MIYFVAGSSKEAIMTTTPFWISFRNLISGATSAKKFPEFNSAHIWSNVPETKTNPHLHPTCQKTLSGWLLQISL